jgi:hypothetical protein
MPGLLFGASSTHDVINATPFDHIARADEVIE